MFWTSPRATWRTCSTRRSTRSTVRSSERAPRSLASCRKVSCDRAEVALDKSRGSGGEVLNRADLDEVDPVDLSRAAGASAWQAARREQDKRHADHRDLGHQTNRRLGAMRGNA